MQGSISIGIMFVLQCFINNSEAIPNPQILPVKAQKATLADPVLPASDCTQCWCQCKSLAYNGYFGSIQGNCNRYSISYNTLFVVQHMYLIINIVNFDLQNSIKILFQPIQRRHLVFC